MTVNFQSRKIQEAEQHKSEENSSLREGFKQYWYIGKS